MSSIPFFTVKWKKWYRILRYHKGFGLLDSVCFGLWLARGSTGATPGTQGQSAHEYLKDFDKGEEKR